MAKDLIPHLKYFSSAAQHLCHRGWAEASAGNMSIRLSKRVFRQAGRRNLVPMAQAFQDLAHEQIIITGTLKRMRDIVNTPSRGVVLIEISADGMGYFRLDGSSDPSSELLMHLAVHEMCKRTRQNRRAVLHTHPTNLIAMTHLKELEKKDKLINAIFSVQPETRIFLENGIRILSYAKSGGWEIARNTAAALERCKVAVWPYHGAVSLAEDLDLALDYIEFIDKAAEIYLKIRSVAKKPHFGQ